MASGIEKATFAFAAEWPRHHGGRPYTDVPDDEVAVSPIASLCLIRARVEAIREKVRALSKGSENADLQAAKRR